MNLAIAVGVGMMGVVFASEQFVSLRLPQAFDIGCRNDASQVVGK